jgi:molybdopterin-guanine dinucleotide biosynthesis protein A
VTANESKVTASATGLAIAIMAGGKSSRMGTDKAFVPLLGKPLIEHVLAAVASLGDQLFVVTNRPDDYAYLGLPLQGDIYLDQGPLGGLHTALHQVTRPHVLIVACDMPWLSRPLLEHMVGLRGTADAVVPRWEAFPEPLHAVYSRACLPAVEGNLQAGMRKMAAFYDKIRVRYVDREEIVRFDPTGRSFANINTPAELAAAAGENGAD